MLGKIVQELERQQYQGAEQYLVHRVKGLGSALDPFEKGESPVVRRKRGGLFGGDMKRQKERSGDEKCRKDRRKHSGRLMGCPASSPPAWTILDEGRHGSSLLMFALAESG
jgi:hypothetical protein